MRTLCLIAFVMSPTTLMAERYVTDPALCDQDMFDIVDAGAMAMSTSEIHGTEYYCSWDRAITIDSRQDGQETRIGACQTSDLTFPKVFTFLSYAGNTGQIAYYESEGDGSATLFHDCEAQ